MIILENLKYKVLKHEADIFIWEVDDDEDGVITKKEFEMMYKRCIFDVTYLEPRYKIKFFIKKKKFIQSCIIPDV